MGLGSVRRSAVTVFLGACLALAASSCLAPPVSKTGSELLLAQRHRTTRSVPVTHAPAQPALGGGLRRLLGARRCASRLAVEGEAFAVSVAVDDDGVARREGSAQHALSELVLDVFDDGALERPRAELGVETHVRQVVLRGVGHDQAEVARAEARREAAELNVDDAANVLAPERPIHDDFVEAVEEFGAKQRAQSPHGRFVSELRAFAGVEVATFLDGGELGARHVARQDDDRVPEVDGAALPVGEPAVVQYLK